MAEKQTWTTEQKEAIEARNTRLLVSAAAGSGKTAVLTERIINRIICDGVNVDELLIMTFTKAAAAEMKERIRAKLEENKLIHQLAVIDSAQISTIHSFCSSVIRDHCDELDIDPSSRIAQDAELNLLKADVMETMLEEYYSQAAPEFIDFVEAFGDKSIAKGIEDIIMNVYNFAQNDPDPGEWYKKRFAETEFSEDYFKAYTDYIARACQPQLSDMLMVMDHLIDICNKPAGPKKFIDIVEEDKQNFKSLCSCSDYIEFNDAVKNFKFKTLRVKDPDASEEITEEFKSLRAKLRDPMFKQFKKKYTVEDIETEKQMISESGKHMRMLITLAEDFNNRFVLAKEEKNILDFGDLEHLALRVLRNGEYLGRYKEIYVDEYQDTNTVQEEIIRQLDEGNLFMVGDVKQSIYGFRRARPDIFRDKEEAYANEGTGRLITLAKNFRSRKGVIDSVNEVFSCIMSRQFGGSDYNEITRLYAGADFRDDLKPQDKLVAHATELALIDSADMDAEDDKKSAEARHIAARIKALTDPQFGMQIYDRKAGSYRTAKYSDIAILLRAGGSYGDIFQTVLSDAGIPSHCDTSKGYLDSLEVRTVMAALSAIDNPMKDVAAAAFARSAMIGMSDEELALAVSEHDGKGIYAALESSDNEYAAKAVALIDKYRKCAMYMPVLELITNLLDETGYYDYVSALPAGLARKANLDKLKSMAAAYAETGYRGLFNFVRYIENLKTYDTDFGEAATLGDKDDVVRIMTVHASKGLEFPICFIGNVDRGFNFKDSQGKVLVDDVMGIASMYINPALKVRKNTLLRTAIALKKDIEARAEEMRIFYVAMTRAKEQLYLSGCIKSKADYLNSARGIFTAKSWMDWIKTADDNIEMEIIPITDIVKDEERGLKKTGEIRKMLDAISGDEEAQKELDGLIRFEYPYEADVNLHNKVSISELKHRDMELYEKLRFESGKSGGAERGTLYHAVMEKLPYAQIYASADIENAVTEFIDSMEMSSKERAMINDKDISGFVKSPLGEAFAQAETNGKLKREEQFIMGLPAREIGEADSDETVLIQGIIDAYIDDGEITLVDYKTDRVSDAAELVGRYKTQLKYYAKAIEMMRQKPVTKKLIYSFALREVVKLD